MAASKLSPVLLITHKACSEHVIENHPEQPRRVGSIVNALVSSFTSEEMSVDEQPPRVTEDQLLRFHKPEYIKHLSTAFEKIAKIAKAGNHNEIIQLGGDANIMYGTEEACYRGAGGAVSAVDALLGPNPKAKSCFVAVRPPGHHAEPNEAMGFCFFGNAGIAALHARDVYGLKRVAILDWDVHHGNGTQARFQNEKDIFFASSHQMPCYPGTGSPNETGICGNVVNCALPPGSGSEHFRKAWINTIIPKLVDFKPEFIIVSAGFDAHGDDPLAEIHLTDEDFYFIQHKIVSAVPHVPMMSVLEGGYNIEAIARSAVQCVRAQVDFFSSSSPQSADSLSDDFSKLNMSQTPIFKQEKDQEEVVDQTINDDSNNTKSLLDEILVGYEKCLSQDIIRSDPALMSTRVLDGDLSLFVSFDVKHYAAKRPNQLTAVSMKTPFNPDKFNFNKVNQAEKIATVQSTANFARQVIDIVSGLEISPNNEIDNEVIKPSAEEPASQTESESTTINKSVIPCDHIHPVLVNLSPLMPGHCVVPLWSEEGQSQLLFTPQHMAAATEVAIAAGHTSRVGFNSLGAFASINHLHVHIMPLSAGGAEDDENGVGFPIENAASKETLYSGYMSIDLLQWHVPCFAFEGQDHAAVTATSTILVNLLMKENIPYNILFTTTSQLSSSSSSSSSLLKIIVIPRQPQEFFDPNQSGFNGAICELSGMLIAQTQEIYDNITEEEAMEVMRQNIGLESNDIKRISQHLSDHLVKMVFPSADPNRRTSL